MTSHDALAVHMFDVTHWHSNSQYGSLQVSQQLLTTGIDSKACRRHLGQTKPLPTSVREDVNAHVSSQGVVAEDPGGGLQGGMPCQAAPLQQRHCLIVNDPHHLQMRKVSDATMQHYCRQLATSFFELALCTTTKSSLDPTWDHLKLLFEAFNSCVFSFCAHNYLTCEKHHKTCQTCHVTHHDKLLRKLILLYIPVTLQMLTMTCTTVASPVIPRCRTCY